MRRKIYFVFSLSIIAMGITSCSDYESPEVSAFGIRHDVDLDEYIEIATNTSPYNTNDYPDFSSVISFSYSLDGTINEDYSATGVMVKQDWILTAGHNFYVADEQDEPAPEVGIVIYVGNDPNNPDGTYYVDKLYFHPTWISDNEDYLNANDLCLVKLEKPITSVTPAEINFDKSEPIGSVVWYCGFGDYSQQPGQDPDYWTPKHAVHNILDRKSDGIVTSIGGVTYTGGLLAFDFDSPIGDINTLGDDIINSDEALLGPGTSDATALDFEGTTVQGDSGGPLFVKIGNTWKVAGILSGGAEEPFQGHVDGDYGDISFFIRVSTHANWIRSMIN